ncbi:MAG: hypothetical protein NT041_02625 [Candidatus Vogelbacteria bacterium]|nr:hypothetical protein [Candidatus Vogelbacteria bacterium]
MGSYPVYIVNPIIGKSNTVSVSVGMIDCSATPNSVKDYYTQTSVRGLVACRSAAGCLSGFTPDVCVDTTKLNKYYCENGKKWVEMNHLCSKGCSGGACKR